MKKLAILLAFAAVSQAQTISNLQFPSTSWSNLTVTGNVSSTYNAIRVRYGLSASVDCASGSGGTTLGFAFQDYPLATALQIGGLAASSTYCVAIEVSNNGGSTWSSGVDADVTTIAAPGVIPVPPEPPSTFNVARQSFSGATFHDVDAACTDLQAKIDAANAARESAVQVVRIPTTGTCPPNMLLTNPPTVKTLSSLTSSTCTWNYASPHGFSDEQAVRFAGGPNSPGRQPLTANFSYFYTGAFLTGRLYYVKLIDSDSHQLSATPGGAAIPCGNKVFTADAGANTVTILPTQIYPFGVSWDPAQAVQVVSTGTLPSPLVTGTDYFPLTACSANICTTKLALTNGGAEIDITSTGTGTHTFVTGGTVSTTLVDAWNESANEVIITTSAYASLPAEGKRISDADTAVMATFLQDEQYSISPQAVPVFTCDSLARHYRLMGLNITYPTLPLPLTAVDSPSRAPVLYCEPGSGHIVVDQVRVDPLGYPQRSGTYQIFLSGYEMAVIESEILHADIWHAYRTGMVLSKVNDSSVQVSAGTNSLGSLLYTNVAAGTSTLTLTGGTANGTAYVYTNITGILTANLPNTMTATWSCSAGLTCSVVNSATPSIPLDASGRQAASPFGTFTLVSGAVGTATSDAGVTIQNATNTGTCCSVEGTTSILNGGSNKVIIRNNHVQNLGIPYHMDACSYQSPSGDLDESKNWWEIPQYGLIGGPSWDGLQYFHRQGPEEKCGVRVQIVGDRLTGNFSNVTSASVAYALTPIDKAVVTDVLIKSTSTLNSNGGWSIPARSASTQLGDIPVRRVEYSNNTLVSNGSTQFAPGTFGRGWMMSGGLPFESLNVKNNLNYQPNGVTAITFYTNNYLAGGMSMKNNILGYSGSYQFGAPDNPTCGNSGATVNIPFLDCTFPQGASAQGYVLDSSNVFVPSWADAETKTGTRLASTVSTALPSVTVVPDQADAAANWAFVGFDDPSNYRFAIPPASTYGSAGPDIDAQMDDQGVVRDIVLTPGATTIDLSLTAPDSSSISIYVDGTLSETLTGSAGTRTATLAGLSPSTTYTVRILGYYDQVAAMYFNGDQLTTQSVTTTAGPTNGSSLGGNAFIGGNSTTH